MRTDTLAVLFLFLLILPTTGNNHLQRSEMINQPQDDQRTVLNGGYTPHPSIEINSNSDFSEQGWPGSGSADDPYIIEGLNISASTTAINISNTNAYFKIEHCIISQVASSADGIALDNVTNGVVLDCTIKNRKNGVFLSSSQNCTLVNNTMVRNSDTGLRVERSSHCTFMGNTASENEWGGGFYLNGCRNCTLVQNNASFNRNQYFSYIPGFSLRNSNDCLLKQNIALGNSGSAFFIAASNHCIMSHNSARLALYGFAVFSDHCELVHNTAMESFIGFFIGGNYSRFAENTASDCSDGFRLFSSNSTITDNTAAYNSRYGIYLGNGSQHNELHSNRLGHNALSNGFDDGSSNSWDNGTHGNYWADYNGTGPYLVPGSAGSIDNHPFTIEFTPPAINHPTDITYESGTTGHQIVWNPTDSDPACYEVYKNGSIYQQGSWNGSYISISIDGLKIGVHNFTLVVYDQFDNIAVDTVLVTVYPPNLSPLLIPLGIAGVTILVILAVLYRRRKMYG